MKKPHAKKLEAAVTRLKRTQALMEAYGGKKVPHRDIPRGRWIPTEHLQFEQQVAAAAKLSKGGSLSRKAAIWW